LPCRFLADATVFLIVAKSLAAFNIRKPINQNTGQAIEPKVDFVPGIISHPTTCDVTVEPCSADAEALIHTIEVDNPWPRTGDSKTLDEF
jgi:hypothetical protein